jgi:MSHA biogenesis protein MshI
MRIGWRDYLLQRLKTSSKFFSVGIEWGIRDLHIAAFAKQGDKVVWVRQTSIALDNWPQALKSYVEKEKLANTPCHVALSLRHYQILQVDKPKVAENELKQALRWAIKDLLPEHKDLAVDYFDLPQQTSGANKVNVVAIAAEQIKQISAGIMQSGLNLSSISVEELATCNLLAQQEEAIIALMQEPGEEVCLNIIKQGKLYFSRRLRGYESLSSLSVDELQLGIVDNLSIEIQRSMDYFESQLRQAPIKKLLVSLDTTHQQQLCELIHQAILIPVDPYYPDIAKANELNYAEASYTSLGAALSQQLAGELSPT